MLRARFLPVALTLSLALDCAASIAAQSDQGATGSNSSAPNHSALGIKIKPVPSKVPPMPFPPGSEAPGRAKSVEFLAPDQMTEKDKLLEADAESSIQERTTWAAVDFSDGKWSYRQLVCPALPNHLFLQFTRNNGTGDVSMFSASIPRNSEGRVRIVPIQRHGYSLFSPAPINSLTISAFNHIRAEENASRPPDWLMTGLCYAALAGAHPETVLLPVLGDDADTKFPAAMPATMEIPEHGGAIIHFVDVAAAPHPMLWTMTFNGKGKLLKASHTTAPLITAKAIPAPTAQPKLKQIPQTIVDLNPPKAQ
jgi:hypothetical protein